MKFRVSFIGSVLISEFEFSRLMLYIGYKLHHLYIYICMYILVRTRFDYQFPFAKKSLLCALWSSGLNGTQNTLKLYETPPDAP